MPVTLPLRPNYHAARGGYTGAGHISGVVLLPLRCSGSPLRRMVNLAIRCHSTGKEKPWPYLPPRHFAETTSTQQQILKTVKLIKSFHADPLKSPVTVPARPARGCRSNKLWSCLIGLCVRLEHVDSALPLGVRHYKPPASLLPVSPSCHGICLPSSAHLPGECI